MSTPSTAPWGLLPDEVRQRLQHKYWQNQRNLKRLLSDQHAFPLKIALKSPRGNAAIADIGHFQTFVSSWKAFAQDALGNSGNSGSASRANSSANSAGCEVSWEKRNFRSLAEQEVPTHLIIPDVGSLACLLGADAEEQLQTWLRPIRYVFDGLAGHSTAYGSNSDSENARHSERHQPLLQALIAHLETLTNMQQDELQLLLKLLPQLQAGMGRGCYLRALPITFVDTKFIESNLAIIEAIVAALVDEHVQHIGLLAWLHCQQKPQDWLLVKPLCEQTRCQLGGLPLLRLSSDTLQTFALPARNILVVENEQSCLALGTVGHTIAVAGGGRNVGWMQAHWLADKNVGYWGDIDSAGLAILSDVRSKLSCVTPLMMDEQTVATFAERMVPEPDSGCKPPMALTAAELALWHDLRAERYANSRLEQERLPMEYVAHHLAAWLA